METKVNGCNELLIEGEEFLKSSSTETPRLDAEILLAFALGLERESFLIYPPEVFGESSVNGYRDYLTRRAAGEPVAYITGRKDFHDYRFAVNSSVLVPRPETEEMVEAILDRFGNDGSMDVCDVGTGSGNIAVTLGVERPSWNITAVDVSQAALETAKLNAKNIGAQNIKFVRSNLFGSIENEFDLVVSNPPYVDEDEKENLGLEVGRYEPAAALFAPDKGLSVVKRLLRDVPEYLKANGSFYCEIGYDQKSAVEKLFDGDIWKDLSFKRDLAGHWRIVTAVKRG